MIRHHPECERGLFVHLKEELHAMWRETDTTDITNKQFILQLDLESVSYANLQLIPVLSRHLPHYTHVSATASAVLKYSCYDDKSNIFVVV